MREQEQNAGSAGAESSTFQHLIRNGKGFKRHALLFWALMGPGLLTMIGDNDAGGVLEYVITGAHFGCDLHWILDEGASGAVRWRIELGFCGRHLRYSSEHV